jgi:RecB family endonuclease NucS
MATLDARMRLVVARCSVDYSGRLTAHLPSAVRLLMVKADGCVAIHADGGAYKPLNWMNAPNHLDDRDDQWIVTNTKGETLTIHLQEVLSDSSHELGDDPGLHKDGVEANLQHLLAERPWAIEEGMSMLEREYMTEVGPVDLLCRDGDGQVVAVEIKRRGEIAGVEQLTRYLEFLNRDGTLAPVRGILAAQSIVPQAKTLAADRGIGCVEVDYEFLKGTEGSAPRLFDL